MNESGLAVRKVLAREHAPLGDMLIVADDFALPFGKLRFREAGSPGGHNGLRSIVDELGTEKFSRLRIGIGDPVRNARDHVLAGSSRTRSQRLDELLDAAAEAVETWARDGTSKAVNRFNTFPLRRPTRTGWPRPARSTGRPTRSGVRRTKTGWRRVLRREGDEPKAMTDRAAVLRGKRGRERHVGERVVADARPATRRSRTRTPSTSTWRRSSRGRGRRCDDDRRRSRARRRRRAPHARRAGARAPTPDLSVLPPLLQATGTFGSLRERLGRSDDVGASAAMPG